VVTKPGYHPDELSILKAARRLGIPAIAVDTTWDNMVSKRPPYVLPDQATMWNVEMADQAVRYYGMPAAAVHVTGGVQFDTFFQPVPDRSRLLGAMGLDPSRPLVLFGLSNPDFTTGTPEFARGVLERVANGAIAGRPNLIIRTHPWDPGRHDYTAGVPYEAVYLDRPYRLPATGTQYECVATRDDVERQGRLYRAADVIINVAGTTSLDGIAVDVPVVNIAFDSIPPPHPDMSVARFSRYSHYLPILETGAVRLAESWEELCDHVNASLRDRDRDAAGRAHARARFLAHADGRAASRVTAAIAALVSP
jgi:hypothetical protein